MQGKARWSNIRYKEQDGKFVTFFYKQIKFASYIILKLSEYDRNYVIAQQFPYWVKEALAYNNHQYYLPFEPKLRFGNISQTFPNTQPSYADAQQIIMPDVRVPPPTHTPILSNNNTIAYDSMTNTESRNLNSM